MTEAKKPRFKHATTDTFDVPDGDLTKERMRELGVQGTINRGVPTAYHVKDGKVYAVRTSRYNVTTFVFKRGVHPVLGGAPGPYWDHVSTVPKQ